MRSSIQSIIDPCVDVPSRVCVCVYVDFRDKLRGRADLERRVLEETRHATLAVEGEMSARVESDTWRLRCEQVRQQLGGCIVP